MEREMPQESNMPPKATRFIVEAFIWLTFGLETGFLKCQAIRSARLSNTRLKAFYCV